MRLVRDARRLLPLLAAPALTSCSLSTLNPAGPIASGNRTILLDALAVMLVIVVPTIAAIVAFAWWFRGSNGKARYQPTFTFSGRIELLVWSIPILTILFLGGLIFYGSQTLDPQRPIESDKPALEVQVVALDWKWLFIYPQQHMASVNLLVLPVGQPVRFRLTSASVMNTFFVPQLGSMVYVMNGMESRLYLEASRAGSFYGESAHFSGPGFSDMNFQVQAVVSADFESWVAGATNGDGVLDADGYRRLSRQSVNVPPATFGRVDPELFDMIVQQHLPPAAGPGQSPDPALPVSPRTNAADRDADSLGIREHG